MKKLQQSVAEFVRQHHLETDVAHRLLDAVSELGEVAKEVLKGSDYGKSRFRASKAWKDELGDVVFSLMCVANTTGVDLDKAVKQALAKYERRIAKSGAAGSRGWKKLIRQKRARR
jgi:NTP pyrophosphatase (non-canonical NTP hydrolase)